MLYNIYAIWVPFSFCGFSKLVYTEREFWVKFKNEVDNAIKLSYKIKVNGFSIWISSLGVGW